MSLKRTIFLLVLLFSCFIINKAWATHERAGYMIWEHIYNAKDPYYYQVTVVTFTRESSYLADRQYLTVCWGDGTCDSFPRIKDSIYPNVSEDIKENWYVWHHSYAGPDSYQISMVDENRIAGINNIEGGSSVQVPLCFFDTMIIVPPANLGYINSPVILNPPMQFAALGQVFYYNPNAYDTEGDSLSYSLTPPKEQPGLTPPPGQSVPGYQYPNVANQNDQESLDPVTGLYTWNAPMQQGTFNVDMYIYQYRKYNGVYIKVGCMDVDIQIIIEVSYDNPPTIKPPRDTCIVAGQTLNDTITANLTYTPPYGTDTTVTLLASGSPFEVVNPATFSTSPLSIGTADGYFNWATDCNNIQYQTYQVVFTAIANYPIALSDQVTWKITVVAPPPQNLRDNVLGNSIVLNWQSPYTCATATNFLGFTVWRKDGCDTLPPDTCDPSSVLAAYTELTPQPIKAYTFTDNSVVQGIDYSYLVVAEFGDSTSVGYFYNTTLSLESNAVCASLEKDVPIITNVSVDTTSVTSGKMYVAWSKPIKYFNGKVVLDTTEYPGPYKYSVYRSVGFNGANPQYLNSYSYTAANFYQFNDSSFTDTAIDTKDNPYSYLVKFYSNYNNGDSVEVGTTNIASSIYLTLVGNNHIVTLTWSENVPWTNDSFLVYRQNHLTKAFDYIATTTSQTYTDRGLKNDTTYCYYVKSIGHYSIEGITNPLIDSSEVNCTVPVDTARPCAPTLTVSNDCNSTNNYGAFVNVLQWTINQAACVNSSILKFYIYYAPYENEPLQVIDSTQGPNVYSYASVLNNTLAGCYAVTTEDSGYTQSYKSNIVCVNNCPNYSLPNVFTPNGDEHNDLFTPMGGITTYIDHIDMHIYNRWGELVFQTTNPMIDWNGKNFNTGKECPDGVYYYTCDVYENSVTGVIKVNPPLKGYVQILR